MMAARKRQRVEAHMVTARVLVIRVGTTPSLLWELRTALCVGTPERTLLALPESANLDDLLHRACDTVCTRCARSLRTMSATVVP
jgi:hypothetical protein